MRDKSVCAAVFRGLPYASGSDDINNMALRVCDRGVVGRIEVRIARVTERDRTAILELRSAGNGARRIQSELRLHKERELSLATIHKVLVAADAKPLLKPRRQEASKRYSRPVPGDRVQMDTMKIAPGVYQYTAVDDCSRFRVLGVYPRRNANATLHFLDRLVEEMPFPIQRIQTDRGLEFFAEKVQRRLKDLFIKFRPIPPRSPHLNGKVERSQLTDLIEFWSRHSAKEKDIAQRIEEWQFEYNWRRSHGSLAGRTPAERMAEIGDRTPLSEEVALAYDETKERMRYSNWRLIARLPSCSGEMKDQTQRRNP